jgi:hypothetical protein
MDVFCSTDGFWVYRPSQKSERVRAASGVPFRVRVTKCAPERKRSCEDDRAKTRRRAKRPMNDRPKRRNQVGCGNLTLLSVSVRGHERERQRRSKAAKRRKPPGSSGGGQHWGWVGRNKKARVPSGSRAARFVWPIRIRL